jgi:tRNA (cytidine/uridine-2'-O-)-methyltransferase
VPINVALYEPEIPPNAGNIIRLCANSGARLHLVEPLGFELDDRRLRRAGLDYHEWARVDRHASLAALLAVGDFGRVLGVTTKGTTRYTDVQYQPNDLLLFGPETRGLPENVLMTMPAHCRIRIPMQPESRSINLSNAVAIVVYEAWRQRGFMNGN